MKTSTNSKGSSSGTPIRDSFEGRKASNLTSTLRLKRKVRDKGIKITIDGIDYTPRPLRQSIYAVNDDSAVESVSTSTTTSFSKTTYSDSQEQDGMLSFYHGFSTTTVDTTMTDQSDIQVNENESSGLVGTSSMPQNIDEKVEVRPPRSFVATETETFFIMGLPSYMCPANSNVGKRVQLDNDMYKETLQRKSKVTSSEMQTKFQLLKTCGTVIECSGMKTSSAFASWWDIYDTFYVNKSRPRGPKKLIQDEVFLASLGGHLSTYSPALPSEFEAINPDDQLRTLYETYRFSLAIENTEKLLASNIHTENQLVFECEEREDPMAEHWDIKFTLTLLWVLVSSNVEGKSVVGFSLCPIKDNLLAVGYGKFHYADNSSGIICLWNIKNPDNPERVYNFQSPVSAIEFSTVSPNLLAVGFYNGRVTLVDISSRNLREVAAADSPYMAALWQLRWFSNYSKEEDLYTVCEDGRVLRLSRRKDFKCVEVMRAQEEQGMARGIHQQKLDCLAAPTPVNCYPAALVLVRHPVDDTVYFLGTAEGCVNRCCTMYSDRPLETMRAHGGPVYAIAFSPFCVKIFLTCGADWCVRVWVETIMEPLVTFTAVDAVNAAVWSPLHSTIIIGVSGSAIYLWDLRCKTTDPAAVIEDSDGNLLTAIKFTADGRNLIVGDVQGQVKIYALHDFPLAPLMKEQALADALEKTLVSQPKLLERVRAIGSPF